MASKRLQNYILRDLMVLEDESNPRSSVINPVYPSTILDQVFDDQTPNHKTLREILDDLRYDIKTGAMGNIKFPVTSVNNRTGDIQLEPNDVGLGRVDNTKDIDKPLSDPQRNAIMDILEHYDFQVNLEDLHKHLLDTNNPHGVTVDQLNIDGQFDKVVNILINKHNYSTNTGIHPDMRQSIMRLWSQLEEVDGIVQEKLDNMNDTINTHLNDQNAHNELFDIKENKSNKVKSMIDTNVDYNKYPSTKAVSDFVKNTLDDFKSTLPDVRDWIEDITVVNSREELPHPGKYFLHHAYIIRIGAASQNEFAICKVNELGDYFWDITDIGSYSKFDNKYLMDSPNGITLRVSQLIDDIMDEKGSLNTSLSEMLKNYYTKKEIDDAQFVKSITILPGTMNGKIRYYINGDQRTMSLDIDVPGLKRLAYLETVTEYEIEDLAVHSRHIMNKAITERHIADGAISTSKFGCKYGSIIGNTKDNSGTICNEITLQQLAEYLQPLILGLPDPTIPGGNTWYDKVHNQIMDPSEWPLTEDIILENGVHGIHYVGNISTLPNTNLKITLTTEITSKNYKLIDAGGGWIYQTNPESWTTLGGSNITGHTFGTIILDDKGIHFESISTGDRMNATYDIWLKYKLK